MMIFHPLQYYLQRMKKHQQEYMSGPLSNASMPTFNRRLLSESFQNLTRPSVTYIATSSHGSGIASLGLVAEYSCGSAWSRGPARPPRRLMALDKLSSTRSSAFRRQF